MAGWQAPRHAHTGANKRTAAGVIGIVLALIAGAALILAALNLATADAMTRPDGLIPYWLRTELVETSLFRVLLFGGVAAFFALVGVLLGALARRGAAGKIAIVLATLTLCGSTYASVRSFTHGPVERDTTLAYDAD
jgi:hypothetical protein